MSTKKSIKDDFVFEYKGKIYPTCIREGNAAGYVVPFASHFCKGKGLDIGGFFDWTFPGATPVNILIEDKWDAYHLPDEKYDYIFNAANILIGDEADNITAEVLKALNEKYAGKPVNE